MAKLFWSDKTVQIQKGAKIGRGTKIWQNSQVLSGAEIGENCKIGHNCFIGSGAKMGMGVKLESNIDLWDKVVLQDYVFVGPSAVFTNDKTPRAKYPKKEFPQYGKWSATLVKEGATIGANSTIICGNTIGKWALVGAGAVVADNVPDFAIVVGNPAKAVGWVCQCGNRVEFKSEKAVCKICKRKYQKKNNKVYEIS